MLSGTLARLWLAAQSEWGFPAWCVCPAPGAQLLGITEEALAYAKPGSLLSHGAESQAGGAILAPLLILLDRETEFH